MTDDGSPLTLSIYKMLKKQGWKKVIILDFPESIVPRSHKTDTLSNRFSFKSLDEEEIRETLSQIETKEGKIGAFIHNHPANNLKFQIETAFPESDKSILKQVFFLAKHLQTHLSENADRYRNVFMTVTRLNGKLGFGSPGDFSSIAGGLYGLVKTANIEWPSVFCRAIDFDPNMNDDEVTERLQQELYDPDLRLTETGYSATERVTLRAEVANQESPVKSDIDSNSLFLVSGGARGVTATCVIELAKRYQPGFVLLGRTPHPAEEPEWAKNINDETELKKRCMEAFIAEKEKPTPVKINNRLKPIKAKREIEQTIKTLKGHNSRVEYISVDVLKPSDLKNSLAPVTKQMGKISGIIHGAGVLADKTIAEKTPEDYQSVVSTKIDGLHSLLQCVDPNDLKHLVLFSSAAGFFGNEAQSDYAVANEILNKTAQQIKTQFPKCHVASINWGPWDGGMVTPQLKNMFEQRNIKVIPPAVGAGIMANELSPQNDKTVQIVVGSSMVVPRDPSDELISHTIFCQLALEKNSFLSDHSIGGEPVLPIICALSWMVDSCEKLYPGFSAISASETKVLKGIIFNNSNQDEYQLDINEIEKPDSDTIILEVKISSSEFGNKPVYHYSSVITLSKSRPEIARFPEADLSESNPADGSLFYNNGTLFHGPAFQSVGSQLNLDEKHLTLLCQAPDPGKSAQGQFRSGTFNPFADDVQLQALLIWARDRFQAGSLPLRIGKAEFYRPTPFNKPYYVCLQVQSATNTKLIADVTGYDENGDIYSRLSGAEAFISKTLNDKFTK